MKSKGKEPIRPASPAQPDVNAFLQSAMAHHVAGRLSSAEALYRQILQLSPDHPDALNLLGLIAHQVGKYVIALELIDKSIKINPSNAIAHCNRSAALLAMEQYQAALESCDKTIQLDPNIAEAHSNRGAALNVLHQHQAALESCDKAIRLNPNIADAYSNRGAALLALHQYKDALESCNKAIHLNPNDAMSHNNRGAALAEFKQYEQALKSYERAIQLNPKIAMFHNNRGFILAELKQLPAALESMNQTLLLKPDYPYLYGTRLRTKLNLCDWQQFEDQQKYLEERIHQGEQVVSPLDFLAMSGSPMLQKEAAQRYVRDRFPAHSPTALPRRTKRKKIRIGYYSADFWDHAVSHLMVEVFERHNRDRFEIFGFSFGPEGKDEMTDRVSSAMDHFLNVQSTPDHDVVRLSREHKVDIAVDLMGFTRNSRTGIFAERAAPIQINYLGYPGTMGAEYMDYLIADQTLIPESHQQYYAEKIAYLPDSFQANDSKLVPATTPYTRTQQGLPEQGFVYCCFNNNYKITPATFDIWMRILGRVEGSVLWLLEGSPWVCSNLRNEAERRGISPERILFAGRLPMEEHLARQRLADLFLDTLPFNAGATASPALWAGLPVLTCMGETFAGRMAASLLRAIHLPELITTTAANYEELAVEIGLDPKRILEIKEQLSRNRLTTPLFDVPAFTRHLEAAYTAMYERYQANLPPDHLYVAREKNSTDSLPQTTQSR